MTTYFVTTPRRPLSRRVAVSFGHRSLAIAPAVVVVTENAHCPKSPAFRVNVFRLPESPKISYEKSHPILDEKDRPINPKEVLVCSESSFRATQFSPARNVRSGVHVTRLSRPVCNPTLSQPFSRSTLATCRSGACDVGGVSSDRLPTDCFHAQASLRCIVSPRPSLVAVHCYFPIAKLVCGPAACSDTQPQLWIRIGSVPVWTGIKHCIVRSRISL